MATGRIGTTPVLQVRWSKAPTNGTTSLSGLDDNSVSLVYSVGYEAVYRNGVLLSRGNDYTATNGTTVTLIDATITGDIIEIFANQTVPLSDTFSQTVADGRFIKNTLTTTTGDIIYASGANTPARLGIGSSAQVLTVSGGIPAWATPSSGAVKQVVANNSTTAQTLATTTYTDITGASVTITPTSASNSILILVSIPFQMYRATNDSIQLHLKLFRGATELDEYLPAAILNAGTASNAYITMGSILGLNYKDSPSTTSATTYKLQGKLNTTSNSPEAVFAGSQGTLSITAMEI